MNVPQIQEHVGRRLRLPVGRGERDERREHVEHEGRDDQLAVADLVHDHAADDDAEAEAGEAGAADGAELRAGEAEFGGPVVEDAAADREADAGGENGHEAGPQQALGVRRDAFVATFTLPIVFCFWPVVLCPMRRALRRLW